MLVDNLITAAIEAVNKSEIAFSKFITANDTGVTGGHQAGFHLHKNSYPLYFSKPGIKGENKDKIVKIRWHNTFDTDSRFIYYGRGTRDEYRLTRFGRDFPFLNDDNVGNLLILCKLASNEYRGYVLAKDEDIVNFLNIFSLSAAGTNKLIMGKTGTIADQSPVDQTAIFEQLASAYIVKLDKEFPQTKVLADKARALYMQAFKSKLADVRQNPDQALLQWIEAEYQLFRQLENDRYADIITQPFTNMASFIGLANTILNRRKSRAGKSLEHHLRFMFATFKLKFKYQPKTERQKQPDFIFPGEKEYHDSTFNHDKLIFLAAKTTCRDRWRQILNEADRIKVKHLFTLQQGISSSQLKEMKSSGVKLVVPRAYIPSYPPAYRADIKSLINFIEYVKAKQA